MTPPHVHMHFETLSKAGIFPIRTVGAPGVHGAGVTGMHGIGVSTPKAAEVAEATVGLARDVHMPNGRMLTIGMLSMMFAAGGPPELVRLTGRTHNGVGAAPNGHIIKAPATTSCAIAYPLGCCECFTLRSNTKS